MLIINADDWGKNKLTTDNTLACLKMNRITSVSAMVFMDDSDRAANLAIENKVDVGLHINFIEKMNGKAKYPNLIKYQEEIAGFLLKNKFNQLVYNPFLTRRFDYVYNCQYEEFLELYGNPPTHFDGHRHMHLCSNMLMNNKIAKGSNVRRNFTFIEMEKNLINRLYRYVVDRYIGRHYRITDYFFSICPFDLDNRLKNIINLARRSIVELMVHPELSAEYDFLMSHKFCNLISEIEKGTFIDFIKN